MTPENRRTLNPPHSRAPSHRRIHLQVAPPASPLSIDITNSLLFSNDAPLLSSGTSSLVDHAPRRPAPSSEPPAVTGLDLLSEVHSSVGEKGSRASCKRAHLSSVPFLAAEHTEVGSYRQFHSSCPDNDNAIGSSSRSHPTLGVFSSTSKRSDPTTSTSPDTRLYSCIEANRTYRCSTDNGLSGDEGHRDEHRRK